MILANPVVNQVLDHPLLESKGVELAIKRLDLIHPTVSGNKFFKLKYNLEAAKKSGSKKILTFGGAYSNHIYSTAAAAFQEGLESIGIIRGERIEPLNPTLSFAENHHMQLEFISRGEFRKKDQPSFVEGLREQFGDFYLIPEGGTNSTAIQGTSEILDKEDSYFSHIVCAIGTGGTFAGLANSLLGHQQLWGISSLKGEFIHQEIKNLLSNFSISPEGTWKIFSKYHFGGYAAYRQDLIDFIWSFYENFGVVLDPIYTGKLFFAVWDLISKDQFEKGSKILLIHSGGLQGNEGFTERTGIRLPNSSK